MTKVSRVDMAGRNTLCMGHQGQIPFDGPPVSDTLVGSHQCQHPSNLASITALPSDFHGWRGDAGRVASGAFGAAAPAPYPMTI